MCKDFVVEDLRDTKNAPADFRLTLWLSRNESYSFLFIFNEDNSELSLKKCERVEKGDFESLTSILKIPEAVEGFKVTKINSGAFSGAFRNALHLDQLIIPNTIRSIEANAFCLCRIRELFIPASVSEIQSPSIFQGSMVFSIKIDKNNNYYDSRNDCNAIIDTAKNELVAGSTNSSIPNTVTTIGNTAFLYGQELSKEIDIPISVIRIGEEAFMGCSGIEKVSISPSVKTIEKGSFSGCWDLKEVFIPNSVTKIGKEAFRGCESLEKIHVPSLVTIIDEGVFSGCKNLKEVFIPNSVTKIGKEAFRGCESLERINVPSSVKIIKEGAFRDCRNLKEVVIPNPVTRIETGAFYGCDMAKIITNNPSLLEGTDEMPYKLMLYYKKNNIEAYLQDPEFLRFKLRQKFNEIYVRFFDGIDIERPHRINDALLESLNNVNWMYGLKEFIKYIHLFAMDEEDTTFINLYIDLSSHEIINDKNEMLVDGRNAVFNFNPIIQDALPPIEQNKENYIGILEYSTSPESTVLNGLYQAIVTSVKNKDGSVYYEASPYLNDICDFDINYFDRSRRFFHHLDSYSNIVTNYFYLSCFRFIDIHRVSNVFELFANIGVNGSKANKECIKAFLSEFKVFVDNASNLISRSLQDYRRRQHALEGAISKVMTRNAEHNHGSHVLAHLSTDNSYEMLCDEEIKKSLTSYISNNNVFQEGKNQQLPFFIRYLKDRECYQSEAVFGVSNILTSKKMYGDVFKDIDQVRILLNYISGVSDFSYKINLLYNGKGMDVNNDIAIAMPGDVIGCQAFYVILENIIRNTAKHAAKQPGQITTFTIDFRAYNSFPDYYCVEIDNGIKEDAIDKLVKGQNELINETILNENFKLRNYGLGLIEMKTSAAFLRQLEIAKIDSYEYRVDEDRHFDSKYKKLVILKAINKNGALGYRFFVQKPKEFLLVGNFDVADSKKDAVGKEGVQFISEDEFARAISDGKSFAHPFLLYPNNVSEKTKALLSNDNDSKTLLPIRKVELNQNGIIEVVDIINGMRNILPQLRKCAWKKYLQSMEVEVDNNGIYIGTSVSLNKSSNCRQIVFANHGEHFETYWNNRIKLPELWVENLSSYTQGKLPLFAQYSKIKDNSQRNRNPLQRYIKNAPSQLKMEIFEAYHNKVVALDERIQRFSLKSFEGSIPVSILFDATNVMIPKIKLDREQYDEMIVLEMERFIDNEIKDAFLLIHYGILERMYKTEKVITERLETWAKKAKRVVVTSGRGAHSLQLPDSVCFANLSSVLNAFTENRCKYLINCLINQSRRKNE